MTPQLRKLGLTAHVISSVGWLGAVIAYLALVIAALFSREIQTANAAYLSLEMIGWFVIVPLCITCLLTGVVQSLGTPWGLFLHYWVVIKLVLTVISTIILLSHMPMVSRVAGIVANIPITANDIGIREMPLLIHGAGGLLLLVTATVLSVYKPWGKIRTHTASL